MGLPEVHRSFLQAVVTRGILFRRYFYHFVLTGPDATGAMLDIIARAAHLMESEEFRDRFPAACVHGWRRAFRWQVICEYYLGTVLVGQPLPSRLRRLFRGLPRLLSALRLLWYRGDLSCYHGR